MRQRNSHGASERETSRPLWYQAFPPPPLPILQKESNGAAPFPLHPAPNNFEYSRCLLYVLNWVHRPCLHVCLAITSCCGCGVGVCVYVCVCMCLYVCVSVCECVWCASACVSCYWVCMGVLLLLYLSDCFQANNYCQQDFSDRPYLSSHSAIF